VEGSCGVADRGEVRWMVAHIYKATNTTHTRRRNKKKNVKDGDEGCIPDRYN